MSSECLGFLVPSLQQVVSIQRSHQKLTPSSARATWYEHLSRGRCEIDSSSRMPFADGMGFVI